jgi:argininosuccinate lyase
VASSTHRLTGRISSGPADLLHDEVLEPQFRYELEHLLPHYTHIEKVLLVEYRRMGLLDDVQVRAMSSALDAVDGDALGATMRGAMTDILFALERFVLDRLDEVPPAWHVDRSRNDTQACAQLMFGKRLTLDAADALAESLAVTLGRAAEHLDDVMPGFTHLQPAQVVSPGFHLSAFAERLLDRLERLGQVYDGFDACPMGGGAMSGQELAWDRDAMASMLGFSRAAPQSLAGVASREWLLDLAAEVSAVGVAVSRFTTDLMAWTSGAYGLCELPDDLAGISSAMPQKKNYPVLERIRGRTAHLTAWYVDVATTQRAVPFSNSVESAKEGGSQLAAALGGFTTTMRLLSAVVDRLVFRTGRMREMCEDEFLGGFTLSNHLTLEHGMPWRTAQVVVGRYVSAVVEAGLRSSQPRADLLAAAANEAGHPLPDLTALLADAFDPDAELRRRASEGGTAPEAVARTLERQRARLAGQIGQWRARRTSTESALSQVDSSLSGGTRPGIQ